MDFAEGFFEVKYPSPHLDGQLLYMSQDVSAPKRGEVGRPCELRSVAFFRSQ